MRFDRRKSATHEQAAVYEAGRIEGDEEGCVCVLNTVERLVLLSNGAFGVNACAVHIPLLHRLFALVLIRLRILL